MSSVQDLVALLNQALTELRLCHEENKGLQSQLTSLQAQVTAVQTTLSTPKTRSTKASTSSHVGVSTNSSDEVRFPTNTVSWMKYKVAQDPKFLINVLSQTNYDKFVKRYEDNNELKDIAPADRNTKICEKVWKTLGDLSSQEGDSLSKEFANKILNVLRKSWKEERDGLATPAPAPAADGSAATTTLPGLDNLLTQPLVATPAVTLPLSLSR